MGMGIHRKALVRFLVALLIGLAGVMGTLLLLSEEAGAGPVVQEQAGLPISKIESVDSVQDGAQVEVPALELTEDDDPDLEVTKSASSDPVTAGEGLTYTLVITNHGPYSGTGVLVTDTLPTGVTFITATASQGDCNESGGTVTCTLNTLVVSDTATVTAVVTVNSSTRGTLTNIAEVSANESDDTLANNTYTETTTVNAESDLSLTKIGDSDPVGVGGGLTYTLAITNNGPSDATDVILTDTLPTGVTFIIATASQGDCNESGGTVTCTLNTLVVSDTATVTVAVTVISSLPNGTVLTNIAVVDSQETTPFSVTEITTVLAPVLHLEKSDDPDPVDAGEYLTYTLTYSNTGDQMATGVVITDVLDPNVSYVTASLTPTGGLPGAPFWSIGVITPDELSQIHVTVAVTRPLSDGTMLSNTAWLDADQITPLPATEGTTVCSSPVLTITKTDYPDPVNAGGTLRYTLIITNSGNENATSVIVTEHYDPNVVFFSSNPNPDPDSEDRVWTFPTLAVDYSESIDIFVEVTGALPVGTVLTNRVTLDSDQTTPVTVTENTSVTSASELTVSKLDSPDNDVQAGGDLMYVISYLNSGTAPAEDVVITETYDSRVTFVSASQSPRTGTDNVWDIGDVVVDGSGNIIVTVRVDQPLTSGTILTNIVTIDSDQTFPKSFTETTTVSSTTDLAFSVTDHPDPVEPGDPLMYTLAYTNTGNADATQVVVTATLDANAPYVTASPLPTGSAGNVWYWEIDKIAGADGQGGFGHGEIVIYTSVTLPLTNSIKLDFAAQLGDAEGDLLPVTAQTTVTSTPVLSLGKSDGVDTVYAGDRLTYTLTYANNGKENAYDVAITDTLPSYIGYVGCEIGDGDCQPVPLGDPDEVVFHIPVITAQTSGQARLVVLVDDPLAAGASSLINHARMTHPSLSVPIDVQDLDPIGTRPDLTIAADHAPSLFSPGKLMTYTVTYGNVGQHMDAANVVITTILPTDTVYVGYGWNSSDGRIYTYAAGDLPAGDTNHTITFTVAHPDQPEISAPEFNTPFTIAESGGLGGDANSGDNTAAVYIGVPDLVVKDFTIEPLPLEADVPVTFTIVVENQGTATAWNPDNKAGYWVDVFIAPVPSYPWVRLSEKAIYDGVDPLAPGVEYTLVITRTGPLENPRVLIQFSKEEIRDEIEAFYVKVDNHADPIIEDGRIIGWTRLYGIVPECDEMNNLGGPVGLGFSHVYLPLALR